jgi:hypothetical protein
MGIGKKLIIICIPSIFLILIIALIGYLKMISGGYLFFIPGYSKADRCIRAGIDEFSCVVDALSELGYDSVEIRGESYLTEEEKKMMNVHHDKVRETIAIPDGLYSHISKLFERGVRNITYGYGYDFVTFLMWSSFGQMRGMKYSKTGKIPDGEQLIEVRQLSIEGWYYYVHDYERAKMRNPHLFK